jgi:hypothetical protein
MKETVPAGKTAVPGKRFPSTYNIGVGNPDEGVGSASGGGPPDAAEAPLPAFAEAGVVLMLLPPPHAARRLLAVPVAMNAFRRKKGSALTTAGSRVLTANEAGPL